MGQKMYKKNHAVSKAGSVLTALILSAAGVAQAQEIELDLKAGNEYAKQGRSGGVLEEVVVTARKTEESLQESPISVSAFSGDAMKSMGLGNLKDFDGVVPGLNMGGGGNGVKADGNPYIRGVGQRETKVTVDSAVGTYIDGVYIGRAAGALMDAVDVQSIQVLRGPQGTLFGKNTTGGAIVITTKKPSDYFGGHLDATVGTYGRRNASGAVNLPLIDGVLNSRFTISSTKSDGFITNVVDGKKWSDDDRLMGIAQLRWTPNDVLSADVLWSATKTRQQPRGQKCISVVDEYTKSGGRIPDLEGLYNDFRAGSDQQTLQESCLANQNILEFESEMASNTLFGNGVYEVNTQTFATTFDYSLTDTIALKSVTAWRQTEQRADEDIDGLGGTYIGRKMPDFNQTNQYSQEFQMLGDAFDGRLRYVVGLYGFLEQTDNDKIQDYAGFGVRQSDSNPKEWGVHMPRSVLSVRETNNEAYSVFGQIYYDITDYIELTLGLRYTTEERETTYKEANLIPEGFLENVEKLADGRVKGCTSTLLPGDCIVTTTDGKNPVRPFSEWQYSYVAPGDTNPVNFGLGQFGVDSKSRKDKDWTPMLSVKYLAHDSILDALRLDSAMMFFTYSEGFRSGGVVAGLVDLDNNGINDLSEFRPEFVNNYEIGLKLEMFDQRLRGNFAMFFTDYQDIQVTTVVSEPPLNIPLPGIENAGQAEIKGFEGELTYMPTDQLRFMLNFAYTDPQYKDYTVDTVVRGLKQLAYQRADEPMPRVSDWTAFLSADYTFFTESYGMIIPSIAVKYSSELYHGFDRDSFIVTKAGAQLYSEDNIFVDSRITWLLPDERTTMTFWVKNLEDKREFYTGGIPLVGTSRTAGAIYAEPRTLGLDVSYKFGDE